MNTIRVHTAEGDSIYWFMGDPTLLVVEDARDHAILVRVAARRALPGLDVRVAGDGREGIAYLAGTPPFQDRRSHPVPNLVILDLLMPEVDGFAVLEWVQEQPPTARPPVVVLTSSEHPDHEGRSLDLGADAFYKKPRNLDQLGDVVRTIVEEWIGDERINAALPSAG
ncbi:MAG: response regulator [Longimicrobiales bacterium]|nr:response regulator [Longimicrobiales bacterium]